MVGEVGGAAEGGEPGEAPKEAEDAESLFLGDGGGNGGGCG